MPRAVLAAVLSALTAPAAPAADPAGHRVLAADRSTGKVAVVAADGAVEWEFANRHNVHDLHLLANGNVLTHTDDATVVEISPEKKVVWKYVARPKAGWAGRVEVHSFQRLADGNTVVAESGNARVVEVDPDGKVVKEVPLAVGKPDAHRDTRQVRKLDTGNYLVCHEALGLVREYDPSGRTVWEYKLDLGGRPRAPGHGPEGHGTDVYSAVRLPSGHTLIGGGNNNRVIEVNPAGAVVWSVDQKDLPGVTLAWVTTVQALPNGNVVIGNCHAGPANPQLVEVTRDKRVVWAFKDWTNFGNDLAAAQVLDIPGVIR